MSDNSNDSSRPVVNPATETSKRQIRFDVVEGKACRSELYDTICQNIHIAIAVYDAEGDVVFYNPKAVKLLGIDDEEVRGQKSTDCERTFCDVNGDAISPAGFPVCQVLATGLPVRELVIGVCRRYTTSPIWVLANAEPVFNEKEEIQQVIVAFTDLTSRHAPQKALLENEDRYRELFESNPQPMWVYDLDTLAFLSVNNAAIFHYGYSREEFLAMTIKDIRPGQDVKRLLNNVGQVTDGLDNAGVWRHIKKDGTVIEVEITSHVLEFDQRPAEMVLIKDITERRLMEQEKSRLQSQLNQAQRMESIGRLAGGVAHDFNNMLGVILGQVELTLEQLDLPLSLRKRLEEIQRAAERSADLTRQLLAFARKQTVAPVVLDLNETVTGTLSMLSRLIGENIDLVYTPEADASQVMIDPAQIDQVLTNLCINARDAISHGGTITIETANVIFGADYCETHAGFSPGEYVMLAVSDDGCGMDKETLSKVFEPFFTTKGLRQGTGLGLSTVYGIAKQNYGFVNVYSEEGEGTTVKVYFPAESGKVACPQAGQKMGALAEVKGSETILLAEDETPLLEMISKMLQHQQYHVLAASTPEEAIELAKDYKGDIHLLITDVVMPGMSGRELADELTHLYPAMRCLFMSGYTANVIARQGILDQDVLFIQKPFSLLDLATKLRQILD